MTISTWLARRLVNVLVTAALSLALVPSAHAVPIKWRSSGFQYVAEGKPLKDVLRDFGASQGMAVAISADIDGTVAGKFKMAPDQFLDLLALSYGFVWYYNGAVLHIASAKGVRSTLVKMTAGKVVQLRDLLKRMQIEEARFPIVYDEIENTALVSGPQEYVDVVRELAAHLEVRGDRQGRGETRVFSLSNAWAADREIGGVMQPGVASLMQAASQESTRSSKSSAALHFSQMIEGGSATARKSAPMVGAAQSDTQGSGLGSLLGLKSSGRIADNGTSGYTAAPEGRNGATAESGEGGTSAGGSSATASTKDEGLPVILADASSNSVIIRDLPERMAGHQRLIQTLDARAPLIEIEIHILDIEDGALEQLGIDWTLNTSRVGAATGDGKTPASVPEGGVLTAVVGNFGRYLLARVAALERSGKATVNARPKVATLNNSTALIDHQETFYVRVGGYQSSQLFNVSAGMSMRVTPMVAAGTPGVAGQAPQIKLDVHLQDGQIIENRLVDTLPVVGRSEIMTQAYVNQGQALLLAGYATERRSTGVVAVPGLSRLPLIGSLFRRTTSESKRRERLFLVTPRVLDVAGARSQ